MLLGASERTAVGECEGAALGIALGASDGTADGRALGTSEGKALGTSDGRALGTSEGIELGVSDGEELGKILGTSTTVSSLSAPKISSPTTDKSMRMVSLWSLSSLNASIQMVFSPLLAKYGTGKK